MQILVKIEYSNKQEDGTWLYEQKPAQFATLIMPFINERHRALKLIGRIM